MAKPGGLEKLKLMASYLKKAGIKVGGTFTLRFPEETMDDVRQTIRLMLSLDLDYAKIFIFVLYPGTSLWETAGEGRYFSKDITFRDLLRGGEILDRHVLPIDRVEKLSRKAQTRMEIKQALSDQSRIISGIPSFLLKTLKDPSTPIKAIVRIISAFSGL
jgi:radical SAM superfamily enzyme YgiQ (UPF0313 family)